MTSIRCQTLEREKMKREWEIENIGCTDALIVNWLGTSVSLTRIELEMIMSMGVLIEKLPTSWRRNSRISAWSFNCCWNSLDIDRLVKLTIYKWKRMRDETMWIVRTWLKIEFSKEGTKMFARGILSVDKKDWFHRVSPENIYFEQRIQSIDHTSHWIPATTKLRFVQQNQNHHWSEAEIWDRKKDCL